MKSTIQDAIRLTATHAPEYTYKGKLLDNHYLVYPEFLSYPGSAES